MVSADAEAPAPLPPNLSPMFMLELSAFRWGATRQMRRHRPNSDDNVDREGTKSPASLAKREAEKRKRKRKKEKMPEFGFRLTKEEIDEDFFTVTGAKAPRHPKRRPKAVQCEIEVKSLLL